MRRGMQSTLGSGLRTRRVEVMVRESLTNERFIRTTVRPITSIPCMRSMALLPPLLLLLLLVLRLTKIVANLLVRVMKVADVVCVRIEFFIRSLGAEAVSIPTPTHIAFRHTLCVGAEARGWALCARGTINTRKRYFSGTYASSWPASSVIRFV